MNANIPIASLLLFYGVFLLFAGVRLFNVLFKTERRRKIAIFYFSGMFLCFLSRVIIFLIMLITEVVDKDHFYIFVTIPEMIYICEFIVLIWHFSTNFIISHINISDDLDVFSKSDVPKIHKITNYVVYVVLPVFLVIFTILSVLNFNKTISDDALAIVDSILNYFACIVFISYYTYLIISFSGRPYKDEESSKNNKKLLIVTILWTCARIIVGTIEIIVIRHYTAKCIYEDLEDEKSVKYPLLVISYFIVTEFIPSYFGLDNNITSTFKRRIEDTDLIPEEEVPENENLIGPQEVDTDNERRYSMMSKGSRTSIGSGGESKRRNSFRVEKTKLKIPFKDLKLNENEDEAYEKKNGLGKIILGYYKEKAVVCREIAFERLSRYDLEAVLNDMEIIFSMINENICPLIGACVDQPNKVIIVTPYYQNGTLHEALHEKNIKFDFKQKKQILLGILHGLQYLNENGIFHCHLSSKNILLDDESNPLIADYGFDNLRENASIFNKYSNKNGYTCPEILADIKKIGHKLENNPVHNYDIYSFGMLMWEMFEEKIPFNVKLQELVKYVVEEKCRPEITKATNNKIAEIIRQCWDTDPSKRPSFEFLIEELEKMEL